MEQLLSTVIDDAAILLKTFFSHLTQEKLNIQLLENEKNKNEESTSCTKKLQYIY